MGIHDKNHRLPQCCKTTSRSLSSTVCHCLSDPFTNSYVPKKCRGCHITAFASSASLEVNDSLEAFWAFASVSCRIKVSDNWWCDQVRLNRSEQAAGGSPGDRYWVMSSVAGDMYLWVQRSYRSQLLEYCVGVLCLWRQSLWLSAILVFLVFFCCFRSCLTFTDALLLCAQLFQGWIETHLELCERCENTIHAAQGTFKSTRI